jgi:ribonuclease HII
MGVIIGMDEAGLGPNLGPFVVAATVWEVPGDPGRCDLFKKLDEAVSSTPCEKGRLQVADSKQVFSPGRLALLEESALVLLKLAGCTNSRFPELLSGHSAGVEIDEWMDRVDAVDLPAECEPHRIAAHLDRLRPLMESSGIRCREIRVDVVFPRLFNRHIAETDNKAETCSRVSLGLLRSVWHPVRESALVIADRHGGRARYDLMLQQTFDGEMAFRLSESPEISRYRMGKSEVRFECRAERHFAVAAASLVAKYIRELSMRMFNAFWRTHVPQVRPTQGYPGDARRFAEEVATARATLGIADHDFWRCR